MKLGKSVRHSSRSVFRQRRYWTLKTTFFFSFFSFLCCLLFSKKEGLDLKPYLAKVEGSAQKTRGTPLSRPQRPFWQPLAAIFDFWGSYRRNDRIKKPILQKLIGGSNNIMFILSPDPVGHFGLRGRLGVAGSVGLQAVSECPWRRQAGICILIHR